MLQQLLLRHCFHRGKLYFNNFCHANENEKLKFIDFFFIYRFIHPVDKNDIGAQVRMAAQCCKLADIMISQCNHLWSVPERLIEQARQMNNKGVHSKRQAAARKLKLNYNQKNRNNNNNINNSNNNISINNNNNVTCINTHTSSSAITNVITNNGSDKIRINTNHIQRIML